MQSPGSPSVHGYLGATSFAATLYQESNPLSSEQTHFRPSKRITEDDIRKGQQLLWLLSDLPQYQPLIEQWLAEVLLSLIAHKPGLRGRCERVPVSSVHKDMVHQL